VIDVCGRVEVARHDVAAEAEAVRGVIGVTGQVSAVDNLLTGKENLQLMADLHHLGRTTGRRKVAELLDTFGLTDSGSKQVSTYSGSGSTWR